MIDELPASQPLLDKLRTIAEYMPNVFDTANIDKQQKELERETDAECACWSSTVYNKERFQYVFTSSLFEADAVGIPEQGKAVVFELTAH